MLTYYVLCNHNALWFLLNVNNKHNRAEMQNVLRIPQERLRAHVLFVYPILLEKLDYFEMQTGR